MPTLSVFFGIIIRMYAFENAQHRAPHIHAYYAEHKASLRIDDGTVLAGSLPVSKMKLVQAWMEIHREELKDAWALMEMGQHPGKIEPLR